MNEKIKCEMRKLIVVVGITTFILGAIIANFLNINGYLCDIRIGRTCLDSIFCVGNVRVGETCFVSDGENEYFLDIEIVDEKWPKKTKSLRN